jgi:hypothetical protein
MSIRDRVVNYLGKKKKGFPDIFHYRNWRTSTLEEKTNALQLLENAYAKKQGRRPCVVEVVKLPPNICGQFNGKTIVLNQLELENPNKNVACVDTIIHEGRHAFQQECVDGKAHIDNAAELQKWRENHSLYFSHQEGYKYYFQSIERDAYSYAFSETKNLFDSLNKQYGEDSSWSVYEHQCHSAHAFYKETAVFYLGHNYLDKIDSIIAEEYKTVKAINDILQDERSQKGISKLPQQNVKHHRSLRTEKETAR